MGYKFLQALAGICLMCCVHVRAAETQVLLEEKFSEALGAEWFWGLGTWTSAGGVLHGFESGPRRHGPVKMRRFRVTDAVVEFEFRLLGKAGFAGIIFNGSQERGHIAHLIMARDQIFLRVHPRKGETVELVRLPAALAAEQWHRVRLMFQGERASAWVDGEKITATHACLAEEKQTFGLGGESGGPAGEKAGALEFRQLRVLNVP